MFLAGALLVYMACLILQRLPLRNPYLQAACLVLLFSGGIYGNFRQPPYPDFPWKASLPKIAAWHTARVAGKQKPLTVPIAPPPWIIDLP